MTKVAASKERVKHEIKIIFLSINLNMGFRLTIEPSH